MNALEAVSQARDVINVRRVYGEPYQEDGLTIIPAANVIGGGGGGGDRDRARDRGVSPRRFEVALKELRIVD